MAVELPPCAFASSWFGVPALAGLARTAQPVGLPILALAG